MMSDKACITFVSFESICDFEAMLMQENLSEVEYLSQRISSSVIFTTCPTRGVALLI